VNQIRILSVNKKFIAMWTTANGATDFKAFRTEEEAEKFKMLMYLSGCSYNVAQKKENRTT